MCWRRSRPHALMPLRRAAQIMALLSELPNEESADPQAAEITRQYERLCSSEYMGELFKVMAITPASSKFGCAGFPPPPR